MSFAVTPHGVPSRTVRIEFGLGSPEVPRVFVDGPQESPHRYSDGSLCMWYPHDPIDLRWARRDGAAALVGCIALHLIREQWWRETGEWPGPEAPHRRTANASTKDRSMTTTPAQDADYRADVAPTHTLNPASGPCRPWSRRPRRRRAAGSAAP